MQLNLLPALAPELIVGIGACILFLMGISRKPVTRQLCALVAVLSLAGGMFWVLMHSPVLRPFRDVFGTLHISDFSNYFKLLACAIGILFVLLSWPTNQDATGNTALNFGTEAGEYFGLMLFSICGLMLTSSANDVITLFLAIELASIPTYVMVSASRPVSAAQEAGVKYFFLGAMAAAIMLMGFAYLYGTTGTIYLSEMVQVIEKSMERTPGALVTLTPWQMLAAVLLIAGFSFKLAAVPLHFYAADVYQGAATPVTAFLSFVPKATGIVAMIKVLDVLGGRTWGAPPQIATLLAVIAVLTMTFGNILGLLQQNVKRVMAYSSIAHSGYMLVGLAVLFGTQSPRESDGLLLDASVQDAAMQGVLFYLAAYGITNAAAFGVLMLLPARKPAPATSAETFDDLAGAGRNHPVLGLAMAAACFSLIGLPFTVGFWGKAALITPALQGKHYALVIFTVINAAISAAYYLRIVASMFLRTEQPGVAVESGDRRPLPILVAIFASAAGAILLGIVPPLTQGLANRGISSVDDHAVAPVHSVSAQSVDVPTSEE
jgi:NADH-quinone oxidoreductase subunit N